MLTRIFLLSSLIALCLSECEFPVMSFGDFNLTSERQLKDIIKKERVFLLGLTSSNCDHCCESEPFYQTLVETLAKYKPRIPFIRHNAYLSPFISKYASESDILPGIYGIKKGVFFKYHDLAETMKVLKFADRLISPVQYMNKIEDVLEYLKTPTGGFDMLKILAVFDDSDYKQNFEKQIEPFSNWFSTDIRAVSDKDVIKELRNLRPDIGYNALVLMRQDATKITDLEITENVNKWISHNCIGVADEMSPYNFQMYSSVNSPMLIMFSNSKNNFHSDYLDVYKKSARKFEGKVRFGWLDISNPEYRNKKYDLGLPTEIVPSLGFNSRNKEHYVFPEGLEFSEKNIDNFVQGFLDGKKSTYTSVYTPRNITLNSCQSLILEELEAIDSDQTFDLVIFIYSSHNSKNSEKYSPIFNTICEQFTFLSLDYIKVFTFDAATNQIPNFLPTSKFPKIVLIPAYSKTNTNIIEYKGDFKTERIMKFIQDFSTIEADIPDMFTKEYTRNEKVNDDQEETIEENQREEL
ncbi:hypothetical protein SteCoe_107 [Stentor coeruleus]|uniref:Thioredoxin domain-containing protein n=1 Tax=Stentor coeruleus TaxID=5963 RepID=A0A1R2D563_9CILI|nr:hypothetical protein SteCoe_107 [Stentor coeruleus]